jgi:hypothetical protein
MRLADFDKRRRQGASHIPARILMQNGAMRYTIILANEIYCRIEFFTTVYTVHVTCLPSAAINVN